MILDHFSTSGRKFKLFIESIYDCRYVTYRAETRRLSDGTMTLTPHGQELDSIAKKTSDIVGKGSGKSFSYYASATTFDEFTISDDLKAQFFAPSQGAFARLKREAGATLKKAVASTPIPPLNLNDGCLAFMLHYGDARILFCGDVTNRVWTEIMPDLSARKLSLESDFILVTHHGSDEGNPSALWERVRSSTRHSTALISCGYENRHKHPSAKTLNRILSKGISLYCINLGHPCALYDINSHRTPSLIETALIDAARPLAERALASIGTPIAGICSGDTQFSVSTSGAVTLMARGQDSHCAYAKKRDFSNEYPATPRVGRFT